MRRIALALVITSLAFAGWADTSSADPIVYTTAAGWDAAIGSASTTVEDFNDTTLQSGLTIDSDFSLFSIDGTVANKMYDRIDSTAGDTDFSFTTAIYAFGGNFDLSGPGGEGSSIEVEAADGSTYDLGTISSGYSGGWWGFVSDVAITSVVFTESGGGVETYTLDNLTWTTTKAVPEPGTIALFGLGAIGLVVVRRRKLKNEVAAS